MNVLFGATGFVGGHVVEYLFSQNEISKGAFRRGAHLKIMDLNGVQGIESDLFDHHSLHEAVEGADTVYSMASPTPFGDADFRRVNTEGLRNLLEAAAELKVKSFVHLGTLDVYGFSARRVGTSSAPSPSDGYQGAKLEAEAILQDFAKKNPDVRVTIVRAARALGSRDPSLTEPLLRMLKAGSVVLPGGGVSKMSFTHPKDIGQAMYRAATGNAPSGTIFLVKSFDASMAEVASALSEATGMAAKVKKQGVFARSDFPEYTVDQLKASLVLEDQTSWPALGYSPQYTLKSTSEEITQWFKKEPWVADAV